MTYASGEPVRAVGGRLALDFVNTANWTAQGAVAAEKLNSVDDLAAWARALGLEGAALPTEIPAVQAIRADLRQLLLGQGTTAPLAHLSSLSWEADRAPTTGQPLLALVAASALAILSDVREQERLKACPGADCGWLFIDETKGAGRRWCSMALCGNRAKAARHYARRRHGAPPPDSQP